MAIRPVRVRAGGGYRVRGTATSLCRASDGAGVESRDTHDVRRPVGPCTGFEPTLRSGRGGACVGQLATLPEAGRPKPTADRATKSAKLTIVIVLDREQGSRDRPLVRTQIRGLGPSASQIEIDHLIAVAVGGWLMIRCGVPFVTESGRGA